MNVEYIKEGRFDNAIWISDLPMLAQYPEYFAIANGTALELWSKLSAELVKAGQLGIETTMYSDNAHNNK